MPHRRSLGPLRVAAVVAAASLAACGIVGQGARTSLTGRYEAVFEDQGGANTWTLDCPSESRCSLRAVGSTIKAPDVLPRTDLREAQFALGYAVEHADAPSPPDAQLAVKLAPLLHASPEITTCWDLRDPEPGYLLACRLHAGGRADPRMFIFATVLAGCGPNFCRFEIIPLDDKGR
jgi:hypothetical protein